MTRFPRMAGGLFPAIALSLTSCGLPTDEQAELAVGFLVDELSMVVGERTSVPFEIVGAGFVDSWDVSLHSSDEAIVDTPGDGTLLALATGEVDVEVFLTAYANAGTDTLSVRVLPDISFESVAPETVSFGEVVTIVGSALDPARLSALSVGGWAARVQSYAPADLSNPAPLDTLRIWVPPGAPSNSRLVALHNAGGTDSWPLTVRQHDFFEPNNASPAVVSSPFELDNPQLAFESGDAFDWYRIRSPASTFTLEFVVGFPVETVPGNFAVSAPRATRSEAPEWSVPYGRPTYCRGLEVNRARSLWLNENTSDKVFQIPVMDPGGDSLDVTVEMFVAPAEARAYSVRVLPGYETPYSPDAFEPNNHCLQATRFTESFTAPISLDSPLDMDWFSFSLTDPTTLVDIELACVCNGIFNFLDIVIFEDTDIGDPQDPTQLPQVARAEAVDFVELTRALPAGDYLLLISNEFSDPFETLQLTVTIG